MTPSPTSCLTYDPNNDRLDVCVAGSSSSAADKSLNHTHQVFAVSSAGWTPAASHTEGGLLSSLPAFNITASVEGSHLQHLHVSRNASLKEHLPVMTSHWRSVALRHTVWAQICFERVFSCWVCCPFIKEHPSLQVLLQESWNRVIFSEPDGIRRQRFSRRGAALLSGSQLDEL